MVGVDNREKGKRLARFVIKLMARLLVYLRQLKHAELKHLLMLHGKTMEYVACPITNDHRFDIKGIGIIRVMWLNEL
jgi:hypothetical protein